MAPTTPLTEPVSFVAGDFVEWTKTLPDFPADEYDLTYAFVKADNQFTVACVADGTDHYAEMSITESDQDPGVYRWQSYATSDDETERYPVGSGTLEVFVNFSGQTSGYDPRTPAEKMLDALNDTLVGKASTDQLALSIGGRSLSKMEPELLLKWRNTMKAEVRRERDAEKAVAGLDLGNKFRTRF